MQQINLITRRGFLSRGLKIGTGVALASLLDVPPILKRALAEGNIGLNGKKLLFIFLRGGNDGLNNVIPAQDPAYYTSRPVPAGNTANIGIPSDPGIDYTLNGPCEFTPTETAPTYGYNFAIRLGNGFAALHPSLRFLAPVYNAGDLAVIHRVAYPKQSRSHFDSQNYWETGNPHSDISKDGIFYRTILESGLANNSPLTGVSIQSSLPLLLRGSKAAMTNLSDVDRYDLLGVPNNPAGNAKADSAIFTANDLPFALKKNRELLRLQYKNLLDTLPLFTDIATELDTEFLDNENTDGDYPYNLFPVSNATNGGWVRSQNPLVTDAAKYVVDTANSSYSFFTNLKAAALVLNKTDAIIAGTEMGGFDTHNMQGGLTGTHPNLLRRIGWAFYALRKYFTHHNERVDWDNLVVVTLSEFGRTTIQNSDLGSDHAEGTVMYVAGGGVKGYNTANPSGVFGCHPNDPIPWIPGPADQSGGVDGTMFGVSNRYLKRSHDYRSVLGEIIRKHLGATQPQIERIISGYSVPGEHLLAGGISSIDNTEIQGEVGIL